MNVKASPGFGGKVGRTLGSAVRFFIFGEHRWIKRGLAVALILPPLCYFGREMASVVVTLLVLQFVIFAVGKRGISSATNSSEVYEPSEENFGSEPVDNDPYSQNNVHNPLFHESDFNWTEKD